MKYVDLEAKVLELERKVNAGVSEDTYGTPARRKDEELLEKIRGVGRFRVTQRLGSLSRYTPVQALVTHVWSASYSPGGESLPSGYSSAAPNFIDAFAPPRAGYTFQRVADKLVAFTTAGTEVVATTNLEAAIGATPVFVYGQRDGDAGLYVSRGDESLVKVTIRSFDDVLPSTTAYWTVQAAIRRARRGAVPADTLGENVGNALDTQTNGFGAGLDFTLYDVRGGTPLAAGDEPLLRVSAGGTAAERTTALNDLLVTMEFVRRVP